MTAPVDQGYAYNNDSVQAAAHHTALTELLDEATCRRIDELIDPNGSRCLEVAAGAGSIAHWLAGRGARVVATDLKPQHIPVRAGVTIRRHDITSGEALGTFDLVHARLLLNHLPDRDEAVRHLIDALEPGGVLLVEDFWPSSGPEIVAHAPDRATAVLLGRYQTLHSDLLSSHGNDRAWSRRAHAELHRAGLTDVQLRVYGTEWRGGGPGCRLLLAGLGQLRDECRERGWSAADLDAVAEALLDPRVALNGHLVYQASGRKR